MHDLSKGADIAMHWGSKALLLSTLSLMLALGGCGRRGALDIPAAPAATATSGETGQTDQSTQEQKVKPARNDFPLDFLIR